jgi:hypothetical protein
MKENTENNRHKEEWFINDLLKENLMIHIAPKGFTNRFMQALVPVSGLSPHLKKPILDFKGKATALLIFVVLFFVGLSIGHEITGYAGLSAFNEQLKNIFRLDYTIMMTTLLFSLSILLIFNELLKKFFANR